MLVKNLLVYADCVYLSGDTVTAEVILTDLKRLTDCPKYCNPKTLLPVPLTDRRAFYCFLPDSQKPWGTRLTPHRVHCSARKTSNQAKTTKSIKTELPVWLNWENRMGDSVVKSYCNWCLPHLPCEIITISKHIFNKKNASLRWKRWRQFWAEK